MPAPILSIGDLEPARPTIAINRTAPDGWWQRFKFRHFDVLLRWFPVRFAQHHGVYALRLPGEFGLRALQRITNMQTEIRDIQSLADPAAEPRLVRLLQDLCTLVLDAPPDVIASMGPANHLAVLQVFPLAVTAPKARLAPHAIPPTSDRSSPASAASTPATAGRTG